MKTSEAAFFPSPLATVGISRFAEQAREQSQSLSRHAESILLTGPAGSGKESLARSIYAATPRSNEPFVVLNCRVLSAGRFFDSQVLGHLPGAFAGLKSSSLGIIQTAHRGTLFVREIEHLELSSQGTLLDTLERQLVMPLGGQEGIPVDVRLIASTCIDLRQRVAVGSFRKDLLQLISAHVAPTCRLADRMEDLPELAAEILRQSIHRRQAPPKRFDDAALTWMQRYEWPGNLAELRSAIDLAVSLTDGAEIGVGNLRQAMSRLHARSGASQHRPASARFTGSSATRVSIGRASH